MVSKNISSPLLQTPYKTVSHGILRVCQIKSSSHGHCNEMRIENKGLFKLHIPLTVRSQAPATKIQKTFSLRPAELNGGADQMYLVYPHS